MNQKLEGSERKPVSSNHAVIRLPWLGHKSLPFKRIISHLTDKFLPTVSAICCLTTKKMFPTTNKDVLPMIDKSEIVYLFTCECEREYIGEDDAEVRRQN